MRFWVGLTDWDWFTFLEARAPLDEVNFWRPSPRVPVHLDVGTPFLFKLHASRGGRIVGGGYIGHPFTSLPAGMVWTAFGIKNGAASFDELASKIRRYNPSFDLYADQIGCNALVEPFFLPEHLWIPSPSTWQASIQVGRRFETADADGSALWDQVQQALTSSRLQPAAIRELPVDAPRYGNPVLVPVRLGQGTFRTAVIDAYERRCAITNERTLPVLQAAHIKPYSKDGPHAPENGLLLRSDIHTLFDQGYMTVTPERVIRVSRTIREEFENGRDYYALDGRQLRLPAAGNPPPSREYLEWHADTMFRG